MVAEGRTWGQEIDLPELSAGSAYVSLKQMWHSTCSANEVAFDTSQPAGLCPREKEKWNSSLALQSQMFSRDVQQQNHQCRGLVMPPFKKKLRALAPWNGTFWNTTEHLDCHGNALDNPDSGQGLSHMLVSGSIKASLCCEGTFRATEVHRSLQKKV